MSTTLRIGRGEGKVFRLLLTDSADAPIDLAQAVVRFSAKHGVRNGEAALIDKSSDIGGEIFLPDADPEDPPPSPTGEARLAILAQDTVDLADGMTDELVWDLWAIPAQGYEPVDPTTDPFAGGARIAIRGRLVVEPRSLTIDNAWISYGGDPIGSGDAFDATAVAS